MTHNKTLNMKYIPEQIADILEDALLRGFIPPYYVSILSTNGSVSFLCYYESNDDEDWDVRTLAEHIDNDRWTLPLNILIVDSVGKGNHAVIDDSGDIYTYTH